MTRAVKGATDAHARRMIDAGRIVCDPTTGVVLVDGIPRGSNANGYNRVYCSGVLMQSHRVMWIYVHGSIPDGYVINHRDGNRRNNRIDNLEAVTQQENVRHAKRSPNYRGTYPDGIAPDLSDVALGVPDRQLSETEELMQAEGVTTTRRIA
jgi:hypothetical protein